MAPRLQRAAYGCKCFGPRAKLSAFGVLGSLLPSSRPEYRLGRGFRSGIDFCSISVLRCAVPSAPEAVPKIYVCSARIANTRWKNVYRQRVVETVY